MVLVAWKKAKKAAELATVSPQASFAKRKGFVMFCRSRIGAAHEALVRCQNRKTSRRAQMHSGTVDRFKARWLVALSVSARNLAA